MECFIFLENFLGFHLFYLTDLYSILLLLLLLKKPKFLELLIQHHVALDRFPTLDVNHVRYHTHGFIQIL